MKPHEKIRALVARLSVVFDDVQQYRQLLSSRDFQAQRLLDAFQILLDTLWLNGKFRRNLVVATQRLSRSAGLYPTCYSLGDVELVGDHPVAAGGFADIHRGRFLGHAVCLKVIRVYQTSHIHSFLKQFSAEAILWGQLSHPNVLPIYGLYRYGSRPCLVSPWMENGDLNSFLSRYPQTNRILLVSDVASGVDYLHTNDIIHGDLKGANILVSSSWRAVLADFGLSSVSDTNILHWTSHSSVGSKGGSIRWQAPELFDIDNDDIVDNSKASDVYAFSCVCYEIFTGNIPFFEVPRDSAVMLKVKAGARPSRPPVLSPAWASWGLTDIIWALMRACWNTDPNQRPTIQSIVTQHASKVPVDDRQSESRNLLTPAHFRDSVVGGADLLSVHELEAFLGKIGRGP
ncbi:kinase-like domain-containing protein [Lyophyllum atratum]|nr:kinase-like domain-containing protein [Lyophyllum atratum]